MLSGHFDIVLFRQSRIFQNIGFYNPIFILPLKPVNYKSGDIKHQIANVIRPIAKDYHFMSLKEYKALLTLYTKLGKYMRNNLYLCIKKEL
jgi:hypothetical protein